MSNPFVHNNASNGVGVNSDTVNNGAKDTEKVNEMEALENSGVAKNPLTWVKFDDSNSTSPDANEIIERASRLEQSNDSDNRFATIELSNSIQIDARDRFQNEIKLENGSVSVPTSNHSLTTSESNKSHTSLHGVPSANKSNDSSIVTSQNNLQNSNNSFANGDVIISLLPMNESCDWVTPAKFKPHLVPEELMAQPLTLTVEDYVSTMSILLNDYRFNCYIILHKRVLGLWVSIGILALLAILFSGWNGMPLFVAGMFWLMLNALGIFMAIFVKQRLYRMLERCIAQVNTVFSRHNIFLGVDDRGNFSCHKVNLVFVYFDPRYCIKFLQDMLNNSEQQVINNRLNNNQTDNQAVITLNNTLSSIDTADIVITGLRGLKNISQKEKYAEKLLYRYSQRWVRNYIRQQMDLNTTDPGTGGTNAESTPPPVTPRHCRSSKCFCQLIEEHLKYKPFNSLFHNIYELFM